MKKVAGITALVLIVIFIAIGTTIVYRTLYQSVFRHGQAQDFTVHSGESFRSVAIRLETQGFIPSAPVLQLYARVTGVDTSIQQGAYLIPEALSPTEIIAYLSSGQQTLIRVTIPEGRTVRQVAAIFEKAGIASAEEFKQAATGGDIARQFGIPADTMEGYLFPETYYFAENFPAEKIIEHMAGVFFDKLAEIYPGHAQLSPQELHEKVVMASIVEREYRAGEEAPLIASVFYNRLEEGIYLESCATVVYVMTEIEGLDHPSRILFADLERPSDFNTYYRGGLPPSPISGVGQVSLSAAFYPAISDYLFFVLESPDAKRHVFSENYRQHLIASESYYVKLN